jgi:hypothetical protein
VPAYWQVPVIPPSPLVPTQRPGSMQVVPVSHAAPSDAPAVQVPGVVPLAPVHVPSVEQVAV